MRMNSQFALAIPSAEKTIRVPSGTSGQTHFALSNTTTILKSSLMNEIPSLCMVIIIPYYHKSLASTIVCSFLKFNCNYAIYLKLSTVLLTIIE